MNILNDVTIYIVYSTYSINYDTTGEKSPIKYHLQTFSVDFLKDFVGRPYWYYELTVLVPV